MDLPTNGFTMAVLIAFVLPGLIGATIRRKFIGETHEDRDIGISIARGIVFSTVLNGIYLLLANENIIGIFKNGNEAISGKAIINRYDVALLIVAYCVVPAILSLFTNRRHIIWVQATDSQRKPWTWIRLPQSKYGHTGVPTAWDFAIMTNQPALVRVRKAKGEWVGGVFDAGSAATAYPEPRSLFIAKQWDMNEQGEFVGDEPHLDQGVFVTIEDGDLVLWNKAEAKE